MEKKYMQVEWRKKYLLFDMSWVDVKNWLEKTDIIIQPCGACEQHGPHLPLGTDTYNSMLLAYGTAEKVDIPVAPPIWTGTTSYHMHQGKPGTVSLREDTFKTLYYEVCRSWIHHGFNKIVGLCNHAGNYHGMIHAAREIKYETGALVATFRGYSLALRKAHSIMKEFSKLSKEEIERPPRHSGEVETSGVLTWNSDLVNQERAAEEIPHTPDWLPKSMSVYAADEIRFKDAIIGLPLEHFEYSHSGVIGNPVGLSKELAKESWQAAMDGLVEFIEEFRKIKVEVKNREWRDRV